MSRDPRVQGAIDGAREAEYERTHSSVDRAVRDIGYSPKKSSDPRYVAAFERAVEESSGDSGK